MRDICIHGILQGRRRMPLGAEQTIFQLAYKVSVRLLLSEEIDPL